MWSILKEKAAEQGLPLSTVIVEVLHLAALDSVFSLDASHGIAFQGGTCLHLIYGGYRYSEDLDFAGSEVNFNLANEIIKKAESIIEKKIIQILGEGEFKWHYPSPSKRRRNHAYWLSFQPVEHPHKYRLKIEFGCFPVYRTKVLPVLSEFDFLQRRPLVVALAPEELLAEKVAAIFGRPYLKSRDIFDLWYLTEIIKTPVDFELIQKKLEDYDVPFSDLRFKQKLAEINSQNLESEMSRFLPQRYRQQISQNDYDLLRHKALQVLKEVKKMLSHNVKKRMK